MKTEIILVFVHLLSFLFIWALSSDLKFTKMPFIDCVLAAFPVVNTFISFGLLLYMLFCTGKEGGKWVKVNLRKRKICKAKDFSGMRESTKALENGD